VYDQIDYDYTRFFYPKTSDLRSQISPLNYLLLFKNTEPI